MFYFHSVIIFLQISTRSSSSIQLSSGISDIEMATFPEQFNWGFFLESRYERAAVASDDSAAVTPEMMTRQKSWGPGKVSRRKKNTEEVWNNHSSQNMSGGVPKHGGLCPLAREGDEGAKNKRKRNEMTLWIQPIPNDRLKATAAAVSYSASLYNTLHFISGSPLYSLHYSIVDCGLNAVLKNRIRFQLSTYTLHIKIHRVATLIGVHSRPEVPLFNQSCQT